MSKHCCEKLSKEENNNKNRTSSRVVQDEVWQGAKYGPFGILLDIRIRSNHKWYMPKPESIIDNEMHEILRVF